MDLATSTYLEKRSSAHRIDARSKILVLVVYSVGIFFITSWSGIAAYALLLAIMLALFKAPLRKVFAIALPVYVLVAITIIFNIFTPVDGVYGAYLDGFVRGCFFASRILLLLWASMAVCLSVQYTEITLAFSQLLAPLRKLNVPVDAIATVLSIALRFIPLTVEEFFAIRDAQWSRGAPLDEGGLVLRIKAHIAIFVPLFIALFKHADKLATAMDLRCYGMPSITRTSIYDEQMNIASAMTFALLALASIAIAILL